MSKQSRLSLSDSIASRFKALTEDGASMPVQIDIEDNNSNRFLHDNAPNIEEIEATTENVCFANLDLNGDFVEDGSNGKDIMEAPVSTLLSIHNNMNIYRISLEKLVDAPLDWNFFPPLNETKFEDLIDSIIENGLLSPLVVWEQKDEKYMILSGHNRKRAYEELFEKTKDKRYSGIYCTVKGINEIDSEEAKTIIIDSNFVQRGDLTPSLKTKCIMEKYQSLGRKKRNSKDKSPVEMIAEEYNISRAWVFTYYKLRNLIPEIMKMIDDNIISIKAGRVLSNLSTDLQHKLFYNYGGFLNNKRILKIDTTMCDEDIIKNLIKHNKSDMDFIKVTRTIPKNKYNEFIKYVDVWLKDNGI